MASQRHTDRARTLRLLRAPRRPHADSQSMLAQDTAPYSDGWARSDLHAWESQTRESKGTSWRQTPKGRKKGGCCTLLRQPTNHAPGLHGANWILSRKYITCQCVRAPLASLGRGATGWSGDAEGVGGESKKLGRCQKEKKRTNATNAHPHGKTRRWARPDGWTLFISASISSDHTVYSKVGWVPSTWLGCAREFWMVVAKQTRPVVVCSLWW